MFFAVKVNCTRIACNLYGDVIVVAKNCMSTACNLYVVNFCGKDERYEYSL